MSNKSFTLFELSNYFNVSFIGNKLVCVNHLSSLTHAKEDSLSYLNCQKNLSDLTKSKAGIVIISPELEQYYSGNKLIANNPELLLAKCSKLFDDSLDDYPAGVDSTAIVDPSAIIDPSTHISAYCLIGANVIIGKHCVIKSHCVIQKGVTIGDNNIFNASVTIEDKTQIGHRNTIASGVIIGANGFGNVKDEVGQWHTITHFGGVVLGNNIDIGANTVIDRGRFQNTIIDNGVRLDNLVHIAHNVAIGKQTAIAAGSKIAGSTKIGKHCMIAGMVGIENHLIIADKVVIYSGSIIRQSIKKSGHYSGSMPITTHKQWLKIQSIVKKLDKIYTLFKALKKK